MKLIDRVGQRFGRLTVIEYAGNKRWLCRCDCGNPATVRTANLRHGTTMSCGCYRRQINAAQTPPSHRTHGLSRTPEYKTWKRMRNRCTNPACNEFPLYGGRGIKGEDRWQAFENFYADMGPRPSAKHSIDRYPDQNGNYGPNNCRWATAKEQARNLRVNRLITFNGDTKTLAEWAEINGWQPDCISQRLDKLGWSVERALTTPPLIYRRKLSQISSVQMVAP